MAKAKIFVRDRRKVGQDEKKPRFRIIGVAGSDLKIYCKHLRKNEVKEIAQHIDAEAVFLESGKKMKEQCEELEDE